MKRIFTLLAFLVVACSAFSQATVTLECYSCEELSGRYCASCQDSEVNYFKGLLVRTPQGAFEINSPFSVLVRGSSVRLTDWQGDIVAFARRDTPYRNMEELMDVINGCNCQGGGSLTPGSVDTDELADGAVEWDKLSDAVQDSIQAGGGISDGDKGDITVASSGASMTINAGAVDTDELAADAVTAAKIADDAVTSDHIATLTADLDAGSNKITNVTDPTNDQDAATKAYVDAANGATSTISNNVDGSYEHDNGAGTVTTFGYQLTASGDTVRLLDYDDTVVDFVVVSGGYTPPSVSQVTATTSTSIDLDNNYSGIFELNLGSTSLAELTLSNPVNGGRYLMAVSGCSSDVLVFPNNFVSVEGDSLKARLCNSDEWVDFYYNGSEYVTTDTFWVETQQSSAPDEISGLVAWWDASSGVSVNADTVTTWTDRENSIVATSVEGVTFVNGKVFFDGSAEMTGTDATFPDGADARTVIMVLDSIQNAPSDVSIVIFEYGAQVNTQRATYGRQSSGKYGFVNQGDGKVTASLFTANSAYDIAVTFDGSDLDGVQTYMDGVAESMEDVVGSSKTVATVLDGFHIGSRGGSNPFHGGIKHLIIYDKELTSSEITLVKNWTDAN